MFLPAELERGTKALQFDVCCTAIDKTVVVMTMQFCVWTRYFIASAQQIPFEQSALVCYFTEDSDLYYYG